MAEAIMLEQDVHARSGRNRRGAVAEPSRARLSDRVATLADLRWHRRLDPCGSTRMAARNPRATLPCNSRSRFLVNTVTSHTATSIASPTNQRNSML